MPRKEVFWGIVLVVLGALMLFSRLFGVAFGRLLGPLVLVVIGAWVVYGSFVKHPNETESLPGAAHAAPQATVDADTALLPQERAIPLEGAQALSVRIQHGAGELRVMGGAAAQNAVEGLFVGGLACDIRRQGDELFLQLHSAVEGEVWGGLRRPHGLSWSLRLNSQVPVELLFETGAGSATLDLSDVQARVITLKTGVSSTHMTLPAHAGRVQTRVESGIASVEIVVPEGVAAEIHSSSGLASVDVDAQRFPRWEGRHRSVGFDTAANRVSLEISTGIGSVTVR